MRYLTLGEILVLHEELIRRHGGAAGLLDRAALESALAQPRQTFAGQDLHPTLEAKAASLCFSLVSNHPFRDGNKRIGHAAMEVFLFLNGYELSVTTDESERMILAIASGQSSREQLTEWVRTHAGPLK